MADTKITALTALAATPADGDFYPIVDVSDTTMAASGTTKKIAASRILHTNGTANKIASLSVVGTANSFTLGDGANSTTYFNMAGARSQIGYDASLGNVVIQGGTGKGIWFCANNATFASGTVAYIDSGGTVRMQNLNVNGNVGIGTASPSAPLHVVGNGIVSNTLGVGIVSTSRTLHLGASTGAFIRLSDTGATTDAEVNGLIEWYRGSATNRTAWFGHPDSTTENFSFANTTAGGRVDIYVNSTTVALSANSGGSIAIGGTAPSYLFDVGGAAHASSFPTSSDMRLKENIRRFNLTTPIKQKLSQINAYLFEWRDDYMAVDQFKRSDGVTKDTQIGFIAQEVGSAVPQLVTTWRHAKTVIDPETGEPVETNVITDAQAVDYARFIPILWEAAKELYSEVATLKQRVTALEG